MKLWLKTTLTISSLAAASGLAIGGVYLYNKHAKAANGKGYSTYLPLGNNYPSLRNADGSYKTDAEILEPKNNIVKVHFYNPSDVVTSSVAEYNPITNKVITNGMEVDFAKWKQDYISKHGNPPAMAAMFASAIFSNDYIDAVSPKDFSEYVSWFIKNVSWSGDLSSLERFNIKRGIQQQGSAIILGAHENSNKERQEINFYPDAFYGSLPGYSTEAGEGNAGDSVLVKLSDDNGQLLSLDEIQALVANKAKIESQLGGRKFNIRYIKPVDKVEKTYSTGVKEFVDGYEVYIDAYDNLIDEVSAKYPYLLSEAEGYHVDANGQLVYGKYKTVTTETRIPFLSVMATADPNFKGPGIGWLKYVGVHEYGHHTTLQMGQDVSEQGKYEYSGAFAAIAGPTNSQLFSREMQNLYLKARAPHLQIDGTSITGAKNSGEFIQWVENGTKEDVANIYGSTLSDDAVSTGVSNPLRRAAQSLEDLEKVAQQRGITVFEAFLENSWDSKSGTINPDLKGDAFTYIADGHGGQRLVHMTDAGKLALMKDQSGTPIDFETANLTDDEKALLAKHKIFIDEKQPIVQKFSDGTPAYLVYTKDANGVKTHFFLRDMMDFIAYVQANPTATDAQQDAWWANQATSLSDSRTTVITGKDGVVIPSGTSATAADNARIQDQIKSVLDQIQTRYEVTGWNSDLTVGAGKSAVTPLVAFNGEIHSDAWFKSVGFDVKNVYDGTTPAGSIDKFIQNIQSSASTPDSKLVNVDLGTEALGALLSSSSTSGFNSAISPNLLDPNRLPGTFGGNFFQVDAQGKGIGFGIGSTVKTATASYSAIPSGSYLTTERPTAFGFLGKYFLGATATAATNPVQMVYTKGAHTYPVYIEPIQTPVVVNGKVVGFSYSSTAYYVQSGVKQLVPKDTATGNYTGITLKFNSDRLKTTMAEASQKFGTDLSSVSIIPQSLTSLQEFIDKFSIDPLNDFEFTTLKNGHKISVIKEAALSKWFGLHSPISPEIQQALTKAIFDANYLMMKNVDVNLDEASTFSSTSSLYAMTALAQDSASYRSSDVVVPFALEYKPIQIGQLQDLSTFASTTSAWMKSAASDRFLGTAKDTTKVPYAELQLFLDQQRWSSIPSAKLHLSMATVIGPSQDIIDILTSRIDDKYNDKFSDYSYDPAESINRDWIQITYAPSNEEMPNVPEYLKGLTEANTGFEYYIDASKTAKYIDGQMNLTKLANAINYALKDKFDSMKGLEAISDEDTGVGGNTNFLAPNFIGSSKSMTNGYFKDHFLRQALGNELYGEDGKAVADSTIAIKDYVLDASGQPKAVTDRVRATWVWAMRSHGVGSRSLSALWRSADRDASYMFGYVPYGQSHLSAEEQKLQKDTVDSIRFVKFTDLTTGEVKMLPVHTKNNNLHYYESKEHADASQDIHTLEQDGYTSWETDYTAMGGYRDALLASGHAFKAEFATQDGTAINAHGVSLNMGNPDDQEFTGRNYVCENGKPYGQASNYFVRVSQQMMDTIYLGRTDIKVGDVVLNVNNQFNG